VDAPPALMWSRSYEPELIPSVAPPFEVFPSHPAVPGSPSPSVFPRRSMSPPGLPLSLLFGAPFPQIPSRPFPVTNSSALQVTSANLRGVSRARVRCTNKPLPTCPCPILPWAFRIPVHRHPNTARSHPIYVFDYRTETRPDAPTCGTRGRIRRFSHDRLESLHYPHVLQEPSYPSQLTPCWLPRFLASGLRFPMSPPESEDPFLLTCSMPLHSHEDARPRHPTVKLIFFRSYSEESDTRTPKSPMNPIISLRNFHPERLPFPSPLGPCFVQAWFLRCPHLLSKESVLVPGSHPPVLHKASSVPRANPLVR